MYAIRSYYARIIRYFYEDSKGRLWITTDLGLLLMTREQKRSDTLSYTLFRHDANDTTSISANYTVPVIETHNGEIWIGTFGNGINLYHEGTTLTNGYFTSIGTKNGLPNDMIKNIIVITSYSIHYTKLYDSAFRIRFQPTGYQRQGIHGEHIE